MCDSQRTWAPSKFRINETKNIEVIEVELIDATTN